MYYSKFMRRVVFDVVDYSIFSMILSIWLTEWMKKYCFPQRQENQELRRLRHDLMKKSKLLELSSKNLTLSSSLVRKVETIPTIRGGTDEKFYRIAEQIKRIVLHLLIFLQKRVGNKKILNFLFFNVRSYLHFLLLIWKTDTSVFFDPVSGQVVIITIAVSGTTGFIVSWMGVGVTLLVNSLGGLFLTRSLGQQLLQEIKYKKFNKQVLNFLNNEEWQRPVVPRDHTQKIETLNWETKPALKEAAERLGVFEENPNFGGPIKSTDNSLYQRSLKKLEKGLAKKLEKVVDIELESDIIDVDFVDKDGSINIPGIKIRK